MEETKGIIQINSDYRLLLGAMCMHLQAKPKKSKKGDSWQTIGYFNHMELVFRRILALEVAKGVNKAGLVDIIEYWKLYNNEKRRIKKLFAIIEGEK